jgi:hypothetical protein
MPLRLKDKGSDITRQPEAEDTKRPGGANNKH